MLRTNIENTMPPKKSFGKHLKRYVCVRKREGLTSLYYRKLYYRGYFVPELYSSVKATQQNKKSPKKYGIDA